MIILTPKQSLIRSKPIFSPFIKISKTNPFNFAYQLHNSTTTFPELLVIKLEKSSYMNSNFKIEPEIRHNPETIYQLNGVFTRLDKRPFYAYYYNTGEDIWLKYLNNWTYVYKREALEYAIKDIGYGEIEFLIYVLRKKPIVLHPFVLNKTTITKIQKKGISNKPQLQSQNIKRKSNVPKHPAPFQPPFVKKDSKTNAQANDLIINLPAKPKFLFYKFERNNSIIGLQNIGNTCHFNAATQLLAALPCLVPLFIHYIQDRSIIQTPFLRKYIELLMKLTNKNPIQPIAYDTTAVINALDEEKAKIFKEQRDVSDTLTDIITMMAHEIGNDIINLNDMFSHSFSFASLPFSPIEIYIKFSGENLYQCLDRVLPKGRNRRDVKLPSVLLLNIERRTDGRMYDEIKYDSFINLSGYNISNRSKRYKLFAVICFLDAPPHYSILINRENWIWIDDKFSFQIDLNIALNVGGGEETKRIWKEYTYQRKWIAKMLIYCMI